MTGIENAEIHPYKYAQLIFDQNAKAVQWRKESGFIKWCCWTSINLKKKKNLDLIVTPYTKILEMDNRFECEI